MIATIIIILLALAWLGYETDYFRVRLESTEYQRMKQSKVKVDMPAPILALPAGDPADYMMTLTTNVKTLKDMIDELSKIELELTEEVHGYDYSDQA